MLYWVFVCVVVLGAFFGWFVCFCDNTTEKGIWILQQVTKTIAHFKENLLDCNKEKNK